MYQSPLISTPQVTILGVLYILIVGDVDSQVHHSTVPVGSSPIQLTFAWKSHPSGETDHGAPTSTIK